MLTLLYWENLYKNEIHQEMRTFKEDRQQEKKYTPTFIHTYKVDERLG